MGSGQGLGVVVLEHGGARDLELCAAVGTDLEERVGVDAGSESMRGVVDLSSARGTDRSVDCLRCKVVRPDLVADDDRGRRHPA